MAETKISLNDCLWVYGERISTTLANARTEIGAVRERGLAQFMLKNHKDPAELAQLRERVWKTDAHVILTRLHPEEMTALKPIFQKRKNFSVMYDDWWIMPHWFTREAEHVIFRKLNGVAVRMGTAKWNHYPPPLMYNPFNPDAKSNYAITAAALRLPMLAISPIIDLANIYRRQTEKIEARRFLYFPFAVNAADLPLSAGLNYKYDFTNIWSVCGIFLMRDPFVPFYHTFANLYADRLRMSKLLLTTTHSFYHSRRYVYKEYVETVKQSRYTVASGGLCDKFNPNFLECACLGTPMIGRSVPLEAPWFDDCLFPVDIMNLTPATIKPLLAEALEKQPVLRANCLNWRDRLLKMYNPHTLLDMLQAQIDGQPIPPAYLKPNPATLPVAK